MCEKPTQNRMELGRCKTRPTHYLKTKKKEVLLLHVNCKCG